jgi:hypothetical protein
LAAVFLLVVFLAKSITGLFIHNQYHFHQVNKSSSVPPDSESISYSNCSCIDEFLQPYIAADEICIDLPLFRHVEYQSELSVFPQLSFTHTQPSRGPPSKAL